MKIITVLVVAVASIALFSSTLSAQINTDLRGEVDVESLQRSFNSVRHNIILEYLENGSTRAESARAYLLVSGDAVRKGVRLQRHPLRTEDQRHLGGALLIQLLEDRGMGYDQIYDLPLSASRNQSIGASR